MRSVQHVGALDVIIQPALEAAQIIQRKNWRVAAFEVSLPFQSRRQHQVVLPAVRLRSCKAGLAEEPLFMGKMSLGLFHQAIENLSQHFPALAARQRLKRLVEQVEVEWRVGTRA